MNLTGEQKNTGKFVKIDVATLIFGILILIFVYSTVFFALKLKPGIIPDEPEHFILSKHFASSWGIPKDGLATHLYGPVVQRPMAYYWINGRALNLLEWVSPNPIEREMLVALRLVSILYSVMAVVFCYLLAGEILKSKWWQILTIFLLTNTLMFIFISGGVNYDSLSNLCAFAGLYYLTRVLKNKSFYPNTLAWMIWIGLGTQSKVTILPLAAIMAAVWIFFLVKRRAQIDFRLRLNWKWVLLSLLFLTIAWMNFSTYGISILQNGSIFPACRQILTDDQCSQGVTAQREHAEYLPEKINLLIVIRNGYPDPIEWFLDFWIARITAMNYGIFGHLSYLPDLAVTFYRVLFATFLVIAIRHWEKPDMVIGSLLAITAFYILVLLQTNYQTELTTGFKHIAIQGRYIFPVIGLIYTLTVYYLSKPSNTFARRSLIYFTLVLFLWSTWVSPLSASFLQRTEITYLPMQQIPAEQPLGEVSNETEITQGFTSQCHGSIQSAAVYITAYPQTGSETIVMKLIERENGQMAAESTIAVPEIKNNTWNEFPFTPVNKSFGRNYILSISAPQSTLGKGVTVWGSSSDSYPDWRAEIGQTPLPNDMSFGYLCTQPAFSDWFE